MIVALVALLVIAFAAVMFFHPYTYVPMMGYYGYPMYGWWFFPFGFIFFIFIFFIFRAAFWGWGGGWRRRYYYRYGYGDAKEILRQRYARGEIPKDQYEQMMRDLEQHQ